MNLPVAWEIYFHWGPCCCCSLSYIPASQGESTHGLSGEARGRCLVPAARPRQLDQTVFSVGKSSVSIGVCCISSASPVGRRSILKSEGGPTERRLIFLMKTRVTSFRLSNYGQPLCCHLTAE